MDTDRTSVESTSPTGALFEASLALAERAYHFEKALREIMVYGYEHQCRTQHLKAVALIAQEALESAPKVEQ